ncbi:DUF2752 domain-containing protein [Mycobacterium kansasii]|uniref:DUF2752 domain-containing protein n=2 Tax=Mycobacterium kansasii TaxID=1768 RepID=A0A1V3WIM5_MYCKA|nr:DUF2752 domain-containing protein [Mycobacterium kansasii]ETZ98158.1 hypothetical protein I547_6622 [Mycobacterium kansasii 824]AGZ53708.1 membrane protein [Mycobacterium kansasii ATCC 12478]ARG54707.1 hypothetical protein B1T43_01230 [Mycobacterium kansasii]ARG60159.1 hypothetical protein B1T45_01235 [Mycobacterium kansasii]ARG67897.1 hypothetical protein B1T47_01330 [Mycobacterium kansasii]
MEPDRPATASGARGKHARRLRHLYGAAGSAVLLAGALGYVGVVDPHRSHSLYPQCPFKLLTGWNCPACGGLRMTHDLLHGDVAAAINDNVFVVLLLAGIPMIAGWMLLRRRNGQSWLPAPAIITLAVATVVWTVLRNLPGFPLVPTVLGG